MADATKGSTQRLDFRSDEHHEVFESKSRDILLGFAEASIQGTDQFCFNLKASSGNGLQLLSSGHPA